MAIVVATKIDVLPDNKAFKYELITGTLPAGNNTYEMKDIPANMYYVSCIMKGPIASTTGSIAMRLYNNIAQTPLMAGSRNIRMQLVGSNAAAVNIYIITTADEEHISPMGLSAEGANVRDMNFKIPIIYGAHADFVLGDATSAFHLAYFFRVV